MTIARAAAALMIAALAAAAPSRVEAQQDTTANARDRAQAQTERMRARAQATAEAARERRAEALRRREALRERQNRLRRARLAARQGPVASETSSSVARIGREGTLTLVNAAGSVTITSGGSDEVRVEATKRVWDRTEASAKASLADVQINLTERSGAVDIRTTLPRERALDAEVDFTITVPAGASVSVRNGSGDVTVTGVRGELRAEALAGSITASAVGQVRSLRALSGAVQLENAESHDITVSTLGGPVTIRQLRARTADLRTIGGDLIVSDSDAERMTAQSLTGRVELTGRLSRSGRYSLQSQSGDIRLTTGDDDFEVEAATVNGTVRSEFPITVDERREPAPLRSGFGRGGRAGTGGNARVLRGVSGDGGPLVTLRSFSGDIAIARR
jgi:DUF4097 and DUF4098 domain-containing protein YvlB